MHISNSTVDGIFNCFKKCSIGSVKAISRQPIFKKTEEAHAVSGVVVDYYN